MELQDITSLQFNRFAAHMVLTAVVNNTEHALSRLDEVILLNSHEQFGQQSSLELFHCSTDYATVSQTFRLYIILCYVMYYIYFMLMYCIVLLNISYVV